MGRDVSESIANVDSKPLHRGEEQFRWRSDFPFGLGPFVEGLSHLLMTS